MRIEDKNYYKYIGGSYAARSYIQTAIIIRRSRVRYVHNIRNNRFLHIFFTIF